MSDLSKLAARIAKNNDFIERTLEEELASAEKEIAKVANRMFQTEMLLSIVYEAGLDEITCDNAMLLFELKNQPLYFERVNEKTKRKIRAITLYKKNMTDKGLWRVNLDIYNKLPSIVRFFKIDIDGKISINPSCRVELDRLDDFDAYINKLIKNPPYKESIVITKIEENLCFRIIQNQNNELITERKELLPYFDKTKSYNMNLANFQLDKIDKKTYGVINKTINVRDLLDSISDIPGTLPLVKLTYTSNNVEEIVLNKIIHVLGGLGVGKSNFKYMITKYLLETQGLKRIAIVEDKVSTVTAIVKKLRAHGVDAIPVLGRNDEKYLAEYIDSLEGSLEYGEMIEDETLKLLHGFCPIEEMAKMYGAVETNKNYCESFVFAGKSDCVCPLASECGKMERYRRMNSAKVWVLTSAALIKSRVPTAFNPKKKTMFEIVYDNCDLVFIDEVDGTQINLDKSFIDSTTLFEVRELSSDLKKLEKRIKRSSEHSSNLSTLNNHVGYFIEAVNHFNDFSKFSSYVIKEYKDGNIITPRIVVGDISEIVPHEQRLIAELNRLVMMFVPDRYKESDAANKMNELRKNKIYRAYNDFKMFDISETSKLEDKYTRIFESIDEYLSDNQVDESRLTKDKLSKLKEFILFLIILLEIDRHYKRIIYYCELIRGDGDEGDNKKIYGIVSELNQLSFYQNKTDKFVFEPLLENNTGYKIDQIENSQNNYSLKVLSYLGVGRQIIRQLNDIKKPLGEEGPGVIALSGTSFLPASAHFNFNEPVSLLLTSINDDGTPRGEGEIKMRYIPIMDTESMKRDYVRVSGTRGASQINSFKKIISSDKFRKALDDAIVKTKKKILIVVPSYTTAKEVHTLLEMNGYKSVYLARKEDEINDYSLTTAEVEKMARMKEHQDKVCFVVGAQTIYRGYNILDEDRNSYFGAAFFLSRPYLTPRSYSEAITVMHAYDELFIDDYLRISLPNRQNLIEEINERRIANQSIFDDIYKLGPWYEIGDEYRKLVSAFAFAYIKQMIGRMQRNQNKCLVYFVDASFCLFEETKTIGQSHSISMFDYWVRIIEEAYKENEVVAENLYGEFYRALKEMIKDIQNGEY